MEYEKKFLPFCIVLVAYLCYVCCFLLFPESTDINRALSVGLFFIICLATWKLKLERTSIVHLLLLTIFTFIHGRYFVGMINDNLSDYVLGFESFYFPGSYEIVESFFLFNTGVVFLWFGLIVFVKRLDIIYIEKFSFKREAGWSGVLLLVLIMALIPLDIKDKIMAIRAFGYDGLYMSQTHYSFDPLRVLAIILPISVGFCLVSGNRKAFKVSIAIVLFYCVFMLVLGAREPIMTWCLALVWLCDHCFKKRMPGWTIAIALFLAVILATFAEIYRGGLSTREGIVFLDFLYKQGFTSIIAIPAWHMEGYSKFSYLTMLLPVGGLMSHLGIITSSLDLNLANYFAHMMNADYFSKGHGLGWSVFLDLYHISGKNIMCYAFTAFILGASISSIVNMANKNTFIFIVFIALIPKIVYLPRAGLFVFTNNFIYYGVTCVTLICIFCLLSKALSKWKVLP